MERNIEFKDHIGIYDGYITKDLCDEMILFYNNKDKFNQTLSRIQAENASTLDKNDKAVFLNETNIEDWFTRFKTLFVNFDIALKNYLSQTSLSELYSGVNLSYTTFKIQKTLPRQGYHVWHVEHAHRESSKRVLAFTIYLNDVEEGGETEFLHQSARVSPKIGRIVIWPAGYPYVHRGNPPLKGEKYLLTSWIVTNE
jgi:hypothetical protein